MVGIGRPRSDGSSLDRRRLRTAAAAVISLLADYLQSRLHPGCWPGTAFGFDKTTSLVSHQVFTKHTLASTTNLKIYIISLDIMEGQLNDAENNFQNACQLALQRWCALPAFKSSTHLTLLNNFQQLLELSESATILNKLQSITSNDIKSWFLKWRERIPNQWDDIGYNRCASEWDRHE